MTPRQLSVTPAPMANIQSALSEPPPQIDEPDRASEPPSSAPFTPRPRVPTDSTVAERSGALEEPQDLGEALAQLEEKLDRAAEAIRPAWEEEYEEEPGSRRITPAGEVPEVTVHYPQDWQPPPSERVKKRKQWEGTPQSVLQGESSGSDQADQPAEGEALREASAITTPSPVTRNVPRRRASESASREAAALRPPAAEKLDSTAPTAISHPPPPPVHTSHRGWFGALGLAALALLGVGIQLSSHSDDKPPQATTLATHEAAPAAQPKVQQAKPETAAQVPSDEASPEKPAEASQDAAPTAAPTAGEAAANEPPVASELESSASVETPDEATPKHKSRPEREPRKTSAEAPRATTAKASALGSSPAEQQLDPARVRAQLAAAATRARACSAPDGPSGPGSVRVLFDPNGGVLNATVLGAPYAGTATGACIERAFQNAATPAFQGRTQSTTYSFSLP